MSGRLVPVEGYWMTREGSSGATEEAHLPKALKAARWTRSQRSATLVLPTGDKMVVAPSAGSGYHMPKAWGVWLLDRYGERHAVGDGDTMEEAINLADRYGRARVVRAQDNTPAPHPPDRGELRRTRWGRLREYMGHGGPRPWEIIA